MADLISTSSSAMPAWAQPYAQGYLQRAQQVADTPYQAYTGETVAGMNPWQTQAYGAMAQRAMNGSPVMSAANSTLQNVIGGGLLNGNPQLRSQIDAAQGDLARNWNNVAAPSWGTANQRSGSFGNAGLAMAENNARNDLQRNMARIGSDMRFQNYNTERGYQQQALGMAPTFAANDYADINALQQAGQQYQAQDQRYLTDAYQRFQQSQQYPQQQLDIMGNAIGRAVGNQGTQTTSQPGPSTASQLLGGALTGASLYNLLFGG